MTQKKRGGPAANGAAPRNTNTADITLTPGYQRTEPPTPADRDDTQLLADAAERGYRLAMRCTKCGSWIVARKSIVACMGPVCRKRAEAEMGA